MKIKINPKPKVERNRKASPSLEKNKNKNKNHNKNHPETLISLKSTVIQKQHPTILTIATQHTEPKKKRSRKCPAQLPEFLKEFQQITNIYHQSKQINNEQQIDLRCLDQTLDDTYHPRSKSKSYVSISNRYSQKSATLLPSIAQKQQQQQREQQLLQTIVKPLRRSPLSTATNNRAKNTKSAQDSYINDFQIKMRSSSKEKKMTLNVQNVIKSRSKTKSSMSQQNKKEGKRK